jgi:hypothetical protein
MELHNSHIKTARSVLQPCVKAFLKDFHWDLPDHKLEMSDSTDTDIIKQYSEIADYESCLADD